MDNEKLSLLQAFRKWPRISLYCFCLSLNVLLWGYDTAIISNISSMPVFQQVFGEKLGDKYIIPSFWLSLWSVAFPVGTMLGALVGAQIQDFAGRRVTLAIGSLLSVGAIAICFAADLTATQRATLLGGKFVEGVAVGTIICSTQTYISEVVPPRLRGPLLALFPAFQLLGQLMAAVVVFSELGVNGKTSYRVAIASTWPFSAVPMVLAFLLPESPAWLLQKSRMNKAYDAFRKLHGAKGTAANQDLYSDMQKAVNDERYAAQDRTATYLECFRRANRRRTLIVVFANMIPELFGLTLLGHVSYFLQLLGMDHGTSIIVLMLGVVLGLFANIGSFWTLSRFGRRLLILVTLSVVTVIWVSVGIAGCFKSMVVAWYTTASLMLIVVIAGLGCWPASYVVSSETSSLRLRSKTQGIGWLLGGIGRAAFDMSIPYLYNADAADLGAKIGFIFCGTALIGLGVSWWIVPEMKGLSAAEIDAIFEKTSVRRVGTAQFERVESEDEVPLQPVRSKVGHQSTEYDAASFQSGEDVQSVEPTGRFEPLRKRPTF